LIDVKIDVKKVERFKGEAEEVIIHFDNIIELRFVRGKDGTPKEVSRSLLSGERLYDEDKLKIPKEPFAAIKRQVIAIFKKKGHQVIRGDRRNTV